METFLGRDSFHTFSLLFISGFPKFYFNGGWGGGGGGVADAAMVTAPERNVSPLPTIKFWIRPCIKTSVWVSLIFMKINNSCNIYDGPNIK